MTFAVVVRHDPDDVANHVAQLWWDLLASLTQSQERVDVVLTGGTVAAQVHRALAEMAARATEPSTTQCGVVDWSRVHFWWGDERFVAADDPERNVRQAEHALLTHLPLQPEQLHSFPAADGATDLSTAASSGARDVATAPERWDLVMLGTGPDGHVASLFPEHPNTDLYGDVVAVRDSPKPPAERISMSADRLSHTARLWVFATGTSKAASVARAHSQSPSRRQPGRDLPLAQVSGAAARHGAEVTWFLDDEAASLLAE